ncbi:MAG: hypothetical protein Q7T73_10535, partial [Beijerinckiaceae bacterium]|nr:hypothetical protein [Beijerinckiaceae bacterium]
MAAVFILMGIYGGDMPLGALCASIVLGAMGGSVGAGRRRAAADAALRRARIAGVCATSVRGARSAHQWLSDGLVSWALLLVTLGRSTATLAGVLSAYFALWLTALSCRAVP